MENSKEMWKPGTFVYPIPAVIATNNIITIIKYLFFTSQFI